MRVVFVAALLTFGLIACGTRSAGRFVVSSAPIDVGAGSRGLCVAVDRNDPGGVWWWEPGRSGCSSRSTGPGVFRAEEARLTLRAASDTIDIQFRLPRIGRPGSPGFADIRLVLREGEIQSVPPGAPVPIERRHDLNVPEWP